MSEFKILNTGITSALGYSAFGLRAGIKPDKDVKDMAMIKSDVPAVCAGIFTKNLVKAAPVKWDKQIAESGEKVNAVIVNTGIANACTGEQGFANAVSMAEMTAEQLGVSSESIFVASTGVIGKQLPMNIISDGIKALAPKLSKSAETDILAAEAIMTTDTKFKQTAVSVEIDGKTVTIGGMAKGSGMIHPNLGTMLVFIATDADISKDILQQILSDTADSTFNMISVDGDTSTNDSVLVLANGLAGNNPITEKNESYDKFYKAFHYVMETLSKKIAADGEGATRLFEVTVTGAKTHKDAVLLSKSVVTSNLTKAAVFGKDANWGRILCAMGYSGADFNPELTDVTLKSEKGTEKLVENGVALDFSEENAKEILSADYVTAFCNVKEGEHSATAWGCDLTYEYVSINADYRS